MKALIFAAGLGTRLGPLTRNMPKALVPVGGVAMLGRVLGKLRDQGFDDVVINACYKAGMIQDWLRENSFPGMNISLSLEPGPEPFETGGGIKFARPLLAGDGPFLAHNVDILSDANLQGFVSKARPEALASLLVTEPNPRDDRFFLFDPADLRLVGWTNTRTGEVRGCIRQGERLGSVQGDINGVPDISSLKKLSFCGIHLISERIFPLLESWPERFSITDFYISQAATQQIYGIPVPELSIVDIGSPETLAKAEERIKADYGSR